MQKPKRNIVKQCNGSHRSPQCFITLATTTLWRIGGNGLEAVCEAEAGHGPSRGLAFDLDARDGAPAAAWQGPAQAGSAGSRQGPGTGVHGPLSAMTGVVSSVHPIPVLVPALARTSVRPGLVDALCRSAIAKCRRLLPGTILHCHHSKSKHGASLDLWAVARTCLLRSSKQNGDIFQDRGSVKPDAESILMHAAQGSEIIKGRPFGSQAGPDSQRQDGCLFFFIFQIPPDLKS